MFPLYVRVCVGTSPKYLTLARLNVILVRALLILSIILTGCGVSGVSAYAGTSNPTRTNTRESRSSTKQERSTGNRKILPATGQEPAVITSPEPSSPGHIKVQAILPLAKVGNAYNVVVSVNGGASPYQFSILWGALPPGLSINPATGTISGTPLTPGTYGFAVLATDFPHGDRGDRRMSISVAAATVPGITVQVSPVNSIIASGGAQQFSATVVGTSNVAVNWSANVGTVSNTGRFTAPAVSTSTTAIVTATSMALSSSKASATLTIAPLAPPPPPAPTITTTTIPDATAGVSYGATLAATGGTPPYQWSVVSGSLPSGIQLSNSSGALSGATTVSGSFPFNVQVADAAGQSAQQGFSLVVLSSGGNCGPPTYSCSRTDLKPVQNPPPPKVGNLTGANTCTTDPDFSNPVCRLTDANTDSASPHTTFVVASSGSADENHFNVDSTLIYVQNVATRGYPMIFDPATLHAARMYVGSGSYPNGMRIVGGAFWSRLDPNLLFQIRGTQLTQYDFTDRVNPPSPAAVYDFANSNCLGTGFTATWTAWAGGSSRDTVFGAGFSNNGGQGGAGAVYVAAYSPGQGCTLLNTKTGSVTGDWGTVGSIPNWTTVTGTNGFTIHNVKISKDGNWLVIVPSSCNTCNVSAYFWQIGTLNLVEPSGSLSGHWTEGYTHWINNSGNPGGQENSRLFTSASNNSPIISGLPTGIVGPFDTHQSWNNVDVNDSYPFLMTTYSPIAPFPTAWYNEILGISPITGTVYRFAHSFITARSHRFSTKNGIGSVSQDGKFFLFSSDWMGTLGSESGVSTCAIGADCRGDVFVVELK